MEVRGNCVTLLVSRAFHADELNEAEIKKAQQAAKEAIAKRSRGKSFRCVYTPPAVIYRDEGASTV